MNANILDTLEKKVETLLSAYADLRQENHALRVENKKMRAERDYLQANIDTVLEKINRALID